MRPEELAEIRSELGLSQDRLAKEILNPNLDRRYTSATISGWERGAKPIPDHVADFLFALRAVSPSGAEDSGASPEPGGQLTGDAPPFREPDAPPQPQPQRPLVPMGTALESVATEMFDGIGAMLETAGVFTRNQAIEWDGKIIRADAKALGAAWGKLAEQNAWVKRILTSLTTGGAWVEVLAVTATTGKKMYDNHVSYAAFIRAQANGSAAAEPPAQDFPAAA